ncbi:amino acid permease [Candidatus Acidianus copahuensis]|uniref:Amino acid permease n=1 Tax=Candidatus Acidianus copahuensis TaxID=1160895 RepID=A0A031LPY3_9CREN|nr:APC family permease [Candidatus Acidianus copahuensis]EZQ04873.1 amino acid permease [Candidatus Acidianus copahuensis]
MRLSKGVISLKENYGQAMAVTAPLGSVVSTTTAAVALAGYSVVFATFLALLASALWIYTLTRYTSRIASAGGFYTFGFSAWRNKEVAFFEALMEAFAYSFLNSVNVIAAYLILQVGLSMVNITLNPIIGGLIVVLGVLYPTLISLTHIRFVLGKVIVVSATAEAVLLVSLFIISLTKGFHLSYLTPGHISFSNLAAAFVLTVVSISGAGASTYLGEETKKPTKNVTNGMWMALSIGGFSMLLGTYALVSLWSGPLSALSNSPQPLMSEMFSFGIPAMAIALILSLNSLYSSNVGTTLGSARILFNLSREKSAPAFLSKVNKDGEPILATITIGLITAVVTGLSVTLVGVQNALVYTSFITGIFWLTGRIVDALGVPVMTYRLVGKLALSSLVIPIITAGIQIWGVITSLQGVMLSQVLTIIVVAGIMVSLYMFKGRKGKPGSLVVDENNELITIDEYIKRLKKVKAY